MVNHLNSLAVFLLFIFYFLTASAQPRTTLYVNGRYLYTPCDEKVVIRGVNKMIVWTNDLNLRKATYAEIRKTGANCVRIVWLAAPGQTEVDAGPDGLDRTIQDCIDNKLIPMVELHDATGYWPGLQQCVNYWISPAVLNVVKKHEKYLLLNIANECGDDQVNDEMFKAGYEDAVNQIRAAGIKCPLVIDGSDWGKNLGQLRNTGQYLLNADSEHNLLFSVHMYWAVSDGANAAYITNEIQQSVNIELPFIIGEFSDKFNRDKGCNYETDYNTIIKLCRENDIGWLAWEWGPGNEYADPTCDIMNMTTDSYFNTLRDTWAKVVAETSPYSIQNTSLTSKYIMNGGKCEASSVDDITNCDFGFNVSPNPFLEQTKITLNLPESENLKIMIYNNLGQIVYTFGRGYYERGTHDFNINLGNSNGQGVYYCVYSDRTRTKSILLNLLKN
ncbi:MAG: T9SS type A sorting domain-containing protein [Bacteroidetes bacterium]|nr:MAG: T9SS type A sorting domain-containing protein [Bacteroidota bacterium]